MGRVDGVAFFRTFLYGSSAVIDLMGGKTGKKKKRAMGAKGLLRNFVLRKSKGGALGHAQ